MLGIGPIDTMLNSLGHMSSELSLSLLLRQSFGHSYSPFDCGGCETLVFPGTYLTQYIQ